MNWFTQERTCTIAALISGALCVTLLFIPGVIFWLFQMPHDVGGEIIAHRAAMLFAGYSFLAWQTRFLASSQATRVIFLSFVCFMGGLALLGVVEFIRGMVGVGIVLAIAAEVFFVVTFWRLARGMT